AGSVVCCLAKDKWRGSTYYLDPDIIYSGLTNCGSGEISARTNLKNTFIVEKVSKDGSYADLTGYFSDGTIKEYHRSYSMESVVKASCERRPNLSRLNYTYHDDYSPKRITAKSYQTLNWLDFNKKHREATISSSNGKTVTYKSFEKEGASYVYEVDSSDSPKQEFHYEKVAGHQRIDRISWPEGRFLEIEYDGKGRVTCQKAPIGKKGATHTLYSLSYHPDDHYTKVVDALGRKTIYRHERHRLTALEQYKKNDKLYRTSAFYWGKKKGLSWGEHPETDDGNLLAEALLDEDNKAHQSRCFVYDSHGNIVKEILYGNLTGQGKKAFSLSSDGTPSSSDVEHYTKHYTYSKNRFHNKLSESETDGPTIKYWYHKGSNIPLGKYICDGNKILIREFYSYDKDWILIQKIVDNGTKLSKKDLSGVTQRLITKIKPVRNKEGFGQGLPKVVAEYYYDLHSKKEALLRRTEYIYTRQGKVSKERVFDASNSYRYTIHTQYDEKGRVHRRRNELGQWFVFEYDKNSNKIFERQIGSGFHTTYSYNKANRLTAATEYHRDGTAIGAKYTYDLMGNKNSSTDRYGNKTHYEYDSCGRVKKVVLPELDDGTRHIITKQWDIFNNLQSETDQNGSSTVYEYTARKQPMRIAYADGAEEKFEYNLNGTLKYKWDRSDTKTSYSYDILGRITETRVYDPFGTQVAKTINRYNALHLLSTTDPMGYTTYYDYDHAGRKTGEWTQSGDSYSKKTFEYDAMGRVSCVKAYYGKEIKDHIATYNEYDLLGRVTVEKEVDVTGQCTSWSCFEYDARGNCVKKRYGVGAGVDVGESDEAAVHTPHNSQSECVLHIDEHGHKTQMAIDHGFKNIFNKQVPRRVVTDALGNSAEEYCDTLGRVVSVLKKNGTGALLAATDITYNGTGQKTKQVEHVIVDGQVEHDYTVVWEHDKLDRVVKCVEQPGTTDEKITQYEYDKSGRLLRLVKPDGVVLDHSYDALGRLLRLSSSDGSVAYAYTYDLHNNPLEVKDEVNDIVTIRSYDAWDRVLTDGVEGVFAQAFTYDEVGRLTSVVGPDNSVVTYGYDKTHLRTITRSSAKGTYQHRYDKFDLRDNVLHSTLIGAAGEIGYEWDKKGRNTKIASKHFSQEIPADGFDAAGNLRKFSSVDPVGTLDCEANYDDLYQLTEESGVQSHSYSNDSLSNRKSKNGWEYYVDNANKLVSDSVENYVYDQNGNMIEKRSDYRVVYYDYDALDRLVRVIDNGSVITYTYDYLHRRIARSKTGRDGDGDGNENGNEDAEYFLYMGCREVGLYEAKMGTVKEYRVLGLGKGAELGASVAIELSGGVYSPIHDHRGDIVCLVDANTGVVQESYRYTAFGECKTYDSQQLPAARGSEVGNPWGYSSKRLDPETGFLYFHRRYYAPEVGRWVTPDPLGFADGPNLYSYVHSNPLSRFD
ncbi:MAG: hypothetical protein JSR46_04540, partial [Verrucomicrobia bacterium]|nr:hypothetical protein [Verrucomicrobiota bacterium]